MICLEDVCFAYETAPNPESGLGGCLFDHVSFTASAGERWAVIGPSGCGKSTLLHLLAGLLPPQSGRVTYGGEPLRQPHAAISVILQEYGLFPWKTVRNNVALPLLLQKKPRRLAIATADKILEQLGLWDQRHKYPGQLSGGQRQRVAIGRSLAVKPRVLLMDEPFSALDALTRESLQQILRELCDAEQLTLVLVTHNIEEAAFLGEKILVWGGGAPGELGRVVTNPGSRGADYRSTGAYDECCRQLRAWLAAPIY